MLVNIHLLQVPGAEGLGAAWHLPLLCTVCLEWGGSSLPGWCAGVPSPGKSLVCPRHEGLVCLPQGIVWCAWCVLTRKVWCAFPMQGIVWCAFPGLVCPRQEGLVCLPHAGDSLVCFSGSGVPSPGRSGVPSPCRG